MEEALDVYDVGSVESDNELSALSQHLVTLY